MRILNMNMLHRLVILSSVFTLPVSIIQAAEMDHSQHLSMEQSQPMDMDHSQHMNMEQNQPVKMDHANMQHATSESTKSLPVKQGQLQRLSEMPASGRAREAGSDGRYAMETTTVSNDILTKCAQATRGLVMVDNATWAQCGGKPKGWSEGPANAAPMDHSQHMMH